MKKQILAIFLSVSLLGFAFGDAHAKSEIGFIDTVKILQESKLGKEGIARLETLQTGAVKQLEALEKKRAAADKKKDAELVESLSTEMQAIAYELQNKLQSQQELIFGLITQELTKIVEKYRNDNGLTVIFNHSDVISFDPKADITAGIMKEFNKAKLDFDAALKAPAKAAK